MMGTLLGTFEGQQIAPKIVLRLHGNENLKMSICKWFELSVNYSNSGRTQFKQPLFKQCTAL